jgi:hypothetical protein
MNPCQAHRDELLRAVLDGARAVSSELAAHLADCTACRSARERHARIGERLRGLGRHAAPAALDARVEQELAGRSPERAVSSLGLLRRPAAPAGLTGLVVSAMHAGHRQERVAAWVVGLARRPAPGALDGLVCELPPGQPAPGVLDRLVAEELADPAKSMASRFLRRLERRTVPAGLEHRLAGARARAERGAADRPAARRTRLVALASSALAAALLAWVGLTRLSSAPEEPEDELTLDFQVERARSIDELGPMARSLAGLVIDVHLLEASGELPESGLGEAR